MYTGMQEYYKGRYGIELADRIKDLLDAYEHKIGVKLIWWEGAALTQCETPKQLRHFLDKLEA